MDDADHVDGAAIGQQADMVRMSVDVSCSDAPQVLVRTHDGCPRCAGNTKKRHTCGKRRAPPQGVATACRPSRQRTGNTDESRSTAAALLITEPTIEMADASPPVLLSTDITHMSAHQEVETASERPDAIEGEDGGDVVLESNEERAVALGVPNAMSVEGAEDDSGVVLQLNEESTDRSDSAIEASVSAEAEVRAPSPESLVFAKLVSAVPVRVTPDATDYQLVFTVEGADGTQLAMDKGSVLKYPLKASGKEGAWSCKFCSAKGWSVERTLCCVQCGQPATAPD